MGISSLYAVWIFCGIYGVLSQGDSLRSALNAVDRRQRYLVENYPITYSRENPAVLSYLPDPNAVGENDLAEYFSDEDNDVNRQVSSSFRERLEEGREKELEELSQRVLSNLDVDDSYDNSGYRSRDPWHKYRNGFSRNDRMPIRNRKRQFYPEFGYDSIGLRKRDKYIPSDYLNEYNYLLNMNDDYPSDYIDSLDYSRRSAPYRETEDFYNRVGPNYRSNFRHIPVSKRSSDYSNISKDKKLQNQGMKTDPKVEKDLSGIFANSDKNKSLKYPKKVEGVQKKKQVQATHTPSNSKTEVKRNDTKKEIKEMSSEKPIQITKKSIDWSDYFGLDRRKKSKDDFNKEWLMERYHKAISVSKKNSEYPLQSFHHHDVTKVPKTAKTVFDSMKLENMDQKLKSVEDEIVDDALKYTGANEGVTDPKDIQEVEDGIISRLAKAYSIEKMRRALGEYKMLIDKEREKLKPEDNNEDGSFSEKKRVSVPRKQAVDSNKEEQIEDNHIKCAQGSDDCDEDNYKAPIEVIEQMNYEVGGCPKIQRDCKQFAPLLGEYAKIFEEACNTHQMCLLCGNNNWYPATRQCNILYLSKVFDMCDGKTECQNELQKSVRYLMNISRNIRNNPSEECNLVCPEGADGL